MSIKIFRSQSIAMAALLLFGLFLVSTTYTPAAPAAQDVQTVYQQAIDMYNQGNFSGAIQQFNRVMTLTQDATILTDTYFYLSICYLYEGDSATAKEYIKMMLRNDPAREISSAYPAEYRAIFKDAQKELKKEERQKPAEQPVVQQQPTYYTEPAVQKEKKGAGMWLILGGVVVAGGAVAALLLLGEKYGSIDVSSTPAGATILLDGTDTGSVTPATLTEIEPGSHTVGVQLDGYVNYSATVNVEKKQTATVSANLTAHTITVTNPGAGDVWAKGRNYNIQWNVSGSGGVNVMLQPLGSSDNPVAPSARLLANRSHAIHSRTMANSGAQKSADSRLSFGSKEYRTKDLAASGLTLDRPDLKNPHMLAQPQLRLRAPGDVKPMDIANMLIKLFRGGSEVQTIATSTPNDGSHSWTVPNGVANAGNYVIRIASAISTNVFGVSPQFWITAVGNIQCNSDPTGADIYLDGTDTGFNTNKKLEDIPVGNRTVKYKMDRFKEYTRNVNVTQGGLVTVFKLLDPSSFFEQFTSSALYWEKVYGNATWSATGGVYRCANGTSWHSAFYLAGSAKFPRKYTYEVKVKRTAGSASYYRGIAFSGTNDHKNFFHFRIGSWSYSVVYWSNFPNNGAWVKTLTSSPEVSGNWVTLKVEVDGPKLKFYLNDILHWQTTMSAMANMASIGVSNSAQNTSMITDYDDAKLTLTVAPPSTSVKSYFSEPIDIDFSNIPVNIASDAQFEYLAKKKK